MKQDHSQLHMEFIREIDIRPFSMQRLREAFSMIAYYHHICGVEAELIGRFRLSENKKDIVLYENGNVPTGEPLRFAFDKKDHRNVIFYIYPAEGPFTEEDRNELMLYSSLGAMYIDLMHLENELYYGEENQESLSLPNASGYLRQVTELMAYDVPLYGYSAFYFNLKDFGEINKRYGRAAGDDILVLYGKKLKAFLLDAEAPSENRKELAGHLGGDNFMALIRKERQLAFIDFLSEVEIEMELDGVRQSFPISATIGVWDIRSDVADPGEVVSRPSIALNQAKNVLHQSVAYATDLLFKQISRQREVLKNYETALENEEFVVYYQPKVDSRTGRLVGAEGLVRWIHDNELISPGIFIPALEENGKSLDIDYYVLRHACADISRWVREGYDPIPVSVNFSRKDLKEKRLAENINRIIEESGIDKKLIEIELTETVDTEEHGVLSDFISKLYRMGIMTAIDDFGSGYSSLSTLREFQVHTLKIDRSFVNTDDFSWKDEIILKDIIHMAEELGMDVLCEGVERIDQLTLLNSVGCYVIQGFYYDRPLPCGEFEKRLKEKIYKKR
ncbi:MAG: GGDEF domain-containing phosphodiesterase [Lachnospiraceae bacterium]|nr:GGDEF domain-containing phosphodiesterase [Lachnospiraceae bacterium]